MSLNSLFLLTSVFMLILSTVPGFQNATRDMFGVRLALTHRITCFCLQEDTDTEDDSEDEKEVIQNVAEAANEETVVSSYGGTVPIYGNGDIMNYEDYNDFRATAPQVSGVMIARGALIIVLLFFIIVFLWWRVKIPLIINHCIVMIFH